MRKNRLRRFRSSALLLAVVAFVSLAEAQNGGTTRLLAAPSQHLLSAGAPGDPASEGYLGVDLEDVTPQKAASLHLQAATGALITLVDHDAPAGQCGLKVNDVVLQVNRLPIQDAQQLRAMLRALPPGRQITLLISRDGMMRTVAVQLADRRAMERDIWSKIAHGGGLFDGDPSTGFHIPFLGGGPNVGALVEPLTPQMAQSLGVPGGLMVKQVAGESEAQASGLRVFDVILQVGSSAVVKLSDWERALRMNQGKPVQLLILRDHKRQTLTLQVDSRRHS